jgi:CRISPR-associated protein Csy1
MRKQEVDDSKVATLRQEIDNFVWKKVKGKKDHAQEEIKALDKELQKKDLELEQQKKLQEERSTIISKKIRDPWLEKTSRFWNKVFRVTHVAKFTHSSISGADSIFFDSVPAGRDHYIGTHVLDGDMPIDFVANAAYLGLASFLMMEYDGATVMELADSRDEVLIQALSDDRRKAEDWVERLASVPKGERKMASHTLAKQVFFPVSDEEAYHLISPVFPSSLVHVVQERIRKHKFSETARKAREAHKKGAKAESGYREYPNTATQIIGGENTQNVSQLNAKRGGRNLLLPSLPPTWGSVLRPPLRRRTVFGPWLTRRPALRQLVQSLAHLLATTDYNNVHIRNKRASLVDRIVDDVLQMRAELGQLPTGWSTDEACQIDPSECLWLDPDRGNLDEAFAQERAGDSWRGEISRRFANWLNRQLRAKSKRYSYLPLGDAEYWEWRKSFEKQIELFEKELGYE